MSLLTNYTPHLEAILAPYEIRFLKDLMVL